MSKKKIISFSIGPVQSFIAQARKTKDSYSGSKILSDIIDTVLKEIDCQSIIFPAMEIESKPNRFIAILDKEQDEKAVVDRIEKRAKYSYKDIAGKTFNKAFPGESAPIGFYEQIEDFLDINWAMLDYDDVSYDEIYNELDKLMGAIKNTRIYKQIQYSDNQLNAGKSITQLGETGKKCTICGERNSLFFGKQIKNDVFISRNEALCAVCFVKRYYEREKTTGFPSTAEISLMNVLVNVLKNKNIYHELNNKYNAGFMADLLYEENINIDYIKENNMIRGSLSQGEEKSLIKDLEDVRKQIKDEVEKAGLKLSKYYGVISFDGDDMGKWLSGDRIDKSKILLKDFHKELSKLLGEFAKKARDTIKGPKGRIIYAGGEDFLGYINCQYIFHVMKELRILFDNFVNQPLKEYYSDDKFNLSFSAGISISHYKTPLSNVIKNAMLMEKKAKEIEDKDAFVIALYKRSGEILETNYKWRNDYDKRECEIIDDIENIVGSLKKGYFSSNFIYGLGKIIDMMSEEYDGSTKKNKDIVNSIINTEIRRLIKRSADKERIKENEDESKIIHEMIELITKLYEKSYTGTIYGKKEFNFINLLYIIIFIVKEVYHDNKN